MKRGALSILILLLSATVFSEIVLAEDDEKDAKKRAEKRNDNAKRTKKLFVGTSWERIWKPNPS